MSLVTHVYQITKAFPREEVYGLRAQMRRCAVSVPSNSAEGHGRSSTKDYLRFLDIATGSLYELQTQIEISRNLDYVADDISESLINDCRELERMLSSLTRKLKANKPSSGDQ